MNLLEQVESIIIAKIDAARASIDAMQPLCQCGCNDDQVDYYTTRIRTLREVLESVRTLKEVNK